MKIEKFPQLRFSGFNDEWEEKKLNDYLEPSKQKNFDNNYSKNDVLSVSGEFGIVNQIEFQGRSFAGEFVDNYGVVETNDIVYTKSPLNANPYGIIKNNFGKAGIVSTLYAVYKAKQNVDSGFVQTYFDLDKRLNDYLRPLVRKGAKNDMKVSSADALLGSVIFPSKSEQQKIGSLLSLVDSLIQAKTKKLESLKAVKKSLLQKCFPKADRKVPEMRFAGFNGNWDENEIKTFATVKDGTHATYSRVEKGYLLLSAKNVLDNELYISNDESFVSESDYNVITANGFPQIGDILLSCVGSIGRCCIFNTEEKIAFQRSVIFIRTNVIDKQFLVSSFQAEYVQNQISMYINASTIGGLYIGAVEGLSIKYPSLTEQQKIGQFFSKYDSLICAHQKEINKLKDIKKSLLQKMFV